MFTFSSRKCAVAFVWVILASFGATTSGAEPKVVKANHEVAVNEGRNEAASGASDLSYSPQWPEPPNTGALLLRVFVGTVVVLGLCVGTIWIGKPWLQKLQVAGLGNSSFHLEGSVAVGNRAMLHLVRVGDTQLIAGTDATGLKSLIALPASFKDVLDSQLPETEAEVAAPARAFDARAVIRPNSKE